VVGWVDIFIRREYKELLLESWRFCQREKDLEIYSWYTVVSGIFTIRRD
jgi:hypothetical protein